MPDLTHPQHVTIDGKPLVIIFFDHIAEHQFQKGNHQGIFPV